MFKIMAFNKKFWDIPMIFGNQRGSFLHKNDTWLWHQYAALRQSIEEKLGLPPKPKKPLTPYFRFMAQVRPVLVQTNPQAKSKEIVKLAAQQWMKVDATTKQKLEAEYKQDVIAFIEAQENYNKSLTDDQHEEIRQAKLDKKEELEKQKLKKKMKELGRPKKPLTSFLQFLQDNKGSRGSMPFREWQQNVVKLWKDLPENQKRNYAELNKKNIEMYKKELQAWEEKMVRLGHIDVVRNEALIQPKSKIYHPKRKDASE